jgi:hypothetical protein
VAMWLRHWFRLHFRVQIIRYWDYGISLLYNHIEVYRVMAFEEPETLFVKNWAWNSKNRTLTSVSMFVINASFVAKSHPNLCLISCLMNILLTRPKKKNHSSPRQVPFLMNKIILRYLTIQTFNIEADIHRDDQPGNN